MRRVFFNLNSIVVIFLLYSNLCANKISLVRKQTFAYGVTVLYAFVLLRITTESFFIS